MNNIEKIWEEICHRKEFKLDSFLEWFHDNYSIEDIEKDCRNCLLSYLSENNYSGNPDGIIRWSNQAAKDTNVFSSFMTMGDILSFSETAFKHLAERMISNSVMKSNDGFSEAFHAYIGYALCKQPKPAKKAQLSVGSQKEKPTIKEDPQEESNISKEKMNSTVRKHISGYFFWPAFALFVVICLLTSFFIADSFGHDMETARFFSCAGIICAWGCKDSLRNLMSDFSKNNLWDFCSLFMGGVIGTGLLCFLYNIMASWGYAGALGWIGAIFLAIATFGIIIGAFVLISNATKKVNSAKDTKEDDNETIITNEKYEDIDTKTKKRFGDVADISTANTLSWYTKLSHMRYKKIAMLICVIGLALSAYLLYSNTRPATIPDTVYLDSKHVIHIDRKCNNAKAVYSINSNELIKTYKGQSMMMCTRCVENKTAALLDQKIKGGDN